ncbi:MAG: DUF3466 family protein [Pirellulales bacterium]|nr:DUF3466 family protein [Pirellulales bacterium]
MCLPVNDDGTAAGHVIKYNASDSSLGRRAVRWDGTGADAVELGILGVDASEKTEVKAFAINSSGTAVGEAKKYVSGVDMGYCAARWDASGTGASELENIWTKSSGYSNTHAYAINSSGITVGNTTKYDGDEDRGTRAVRWDASGKALELENLGELSAGHALGIANCINSSGLIAGSSLKVDGITGHSLGAYCVRWDASGAIVAELQNLWSSGSGISISNAFAMNESGTVVGSSRKYDAVTGDGLGDRAVRWDGSGITATELECLGTDDEEVSQSIAVAVNDAGTAVGYSDKYDGSDNLGSRAVRWDASVSTATELGDLGTSPEGITNSFAIAINASGTAVGYANKYDTGVFVGRRAVLWGDDGAAVDLNTLIAPDSGWTLSEAWGISNTGWVAGIGDYDPDGAGGQEPYVRAFLVQVPEPSGLTLLIGVLLGAFFWRRRRNFP